MPTSKRFAAFAAAAAAFCLACKDVPLLPKWNADWNLPLPSKSVNQVFGPAAVTVPAGTSAAVTFTDSITVDGPVGGLLKQDLSNASIIVTVVKSIALGGAPTLQIDSSKTFATSINVAIRLDSSKVAPAGRDSVTPNTSVSQAQIGMLQGVANNNGRLYVRLSGNVHCHTSGTCTVSPTDSILVKLALLSTIAISR